MCGIAGAIGRLDDSLVGAVARASAAMAHRGPDGAGQWLSPGPPVEARVAFAHRRLAIIDLTAEAAQPMIEPASGCALVFNGEIYNFLELRSELEGQGVRFRSRSDSEVLLHAYLRWGRECLSRLRGMFAFALFDPTRRTVLLARDRLGEKPLYWALVRASDDSQCLIFASELRALLASGKVSRRLDPLGAATYAWNGFVYGPNTLVEGVTELPAGTSAEVALDAPAFVPLRYWRIPAARPATVGLSELRTALKEAVRLQMVSDVPLGVFLSGGVDSSAIANLAARAGVGPVRTFNIAFDVAEYDESPHARAVAAAIGSEHAEIRVSGEQFLSSLERALGALDQPSFDGVNTYVVSRAVREAGTIVALAGTGGDELFGGYRSFSRLPRARRWSRRLAAFPEGSLRGGASLLARLRGKPRDAILPQSNWGKLGDVLATRGDRLLLYQTAYALFTHEFLEQLAPAAFAGAGLPGGLPPERRAELDLWIQGSPDLHAVSMLELAGFLGERLLRDGDSASMAASIEVRLPLVDHVLVEQVAALDERTRFHPLGRKQALRDAALAGLDPRLFERPKSGFVMPFDRWCRGELKPALDAVLLDGATCRAAGLDPLTVARLWRAFLDGAPGLYWSRVWSVFVLGWWCREHRVSA